MDKVMLLGLVVVIIPPLPPNITKTEPATAKACSSTKGLFTALYMESGSSRPQVKSARVSSPRSAQPGVYFICV